jgi:uncharacterized protein (TIRG00374 family)
LSRAGAAVKGQFAVGVAISIVCLWIAFRNVDLHGLGETLETANYWWLFAYPVLGISLNLIRAEIWRVMLRRRATLADAFWAYSVGFLVNNVLPFRLGEGARIATLAVRSGLPIVEVGAAAGVERVLDLIAVLSILLATLPFVVRSADVEHAVLATGVTVLIALGGMTLLIVARAPLDRLVRVLAERLVPSRAGMIAARWRELSDGLAAIARPAIAVPVVIGAALVWVLTIVLQWTVLRAFQPLAEPIDAAVMVGIVSIASAVPAAPGSIGTYQWIGRAALATAFPARYNPTMALAIALVSHATSYIFSTLLGVGGVWYCGVSLASLRGTARHAAAPIPDRATNP